MKDWDYNSTINIWDNVQCRTPYDLVGMTGFNNIVS